MKIDVALTPQLINRAQNLAGQIVVVLDILRATSTIVTALGNQARKVIPMVEPDQVFEMKKKFPSGQTITGGERGGFKIEGFDLGNSPAEYSAEKVAGKDVILCTTNGTKAINLVLGAREILIGSFLNAGTVIKRLQAATPDILIVCSGRDENPSLEDLAGAGMIIQALDSASPGRRLTDTAKIARYVYEQARVTGLEEFVGQTEHGQYLREIGMGVDILRCTTLNKFLILPRFENGEIRAFLP
ncbi:MAG: 2-phosphosulfolactate phosphatase [Firmicutes bacterium]|nr:2-phosphosulfolactate phosphatase [Bacillota bacterium]